MMDVLPSLFGLYITFEFQISLTIDQGVDPLFVLMHVII